MKKERTQLTKRLKNNDQSSRKSIKLEKPYSGEAKRNECLTINKQVKIKQTNKQK